MNPTGRPETTIFKTDRHRCDINSATNTTTAPARKCKPVTLVDTADSVKKNLPESPPIHALTVRQSKTTNGICHKGRRVSAFRRGRTHSDAIALAAISLEAQNDAALASTSRPPCPARQPARVRKINAANTDKSRLPHSAASRPSERGTEIRRRLASSQESHAARDKRGPRRCIRRGPGR